MYKMYKNLLMRYLLMFKLIRNYINNKVKV